MVDDRFDDLLRESARDYNEPPDTPRAEIWRRIVAERAERAERAEKVQQADRPGSGDHERPLRPLRLLRFPAGIAALLALGIGLGRLSMKHTEHWTPAGAMGPEAPGVSVTAYRLATTEHLSQSEAFLTLFRVSVHHGRGDERLASATARRLLATNRLLLDSPAAGDPRTRVLLQDLELVLAEIAQLSPQPRPRDLDLITEGLEQGGMLSRLRTAVPAGASPMPGAL